MNIVGYGGGTDSTAMLVGLCQHHVPVDLILFADPGAEQPHTSITTCGSWISGCENTECLGSQECGTQTVRDRG